MKNKQKQQQNRDVQDVLYLLCGKWRGAILASLCDEPKRFNALKRDVGNITARTLTKELKHLELNKLISRKVNSSSGISVTYSLTPHGESLNPLIAQIVAWGQNHRKIVLGKLK
jgi:Predicted transcriptional regulators